MLIYNIWMLIYVVPICIHMGQWTPIAVRVLGGIPSIPPSPLVSFLSPSLHPSKLRLRVASILQVDIQTKVRKIQELLENSDFGK